MVSDRKPTSLRLWLIAAATVSVVGCAASEGEPGESEPLFPFPTAEPQELVFVTAPKVVFTRDGNAVISYDETTTRGPDQKVRQQVANYSAAEGRVAGGTFFERGNFVSHTVPAGEVHALAGDTSGTVDSIYTSRRNHLPPFGQLESDGFWGCRSTLQVPQYACARIGSFLINGSRTPEWEREVAVASNGSGDALALLAFLSTPERRTLTATVRSGSGAWRTPQKIADSVSHAKPSVAYAGAGIAYAMYTSSDGRLAARRYVAASDQWEGELPLAPPILSTFVDNERLVLHRNAPGATAMVLWRQDPGVPQRVRAARYVTTGWRFTEPVPNTECAQGVDAAMSANGDVIAVWHCESGPTQMRVLASHFQNGAWTTPAREIAVVENSPEPQIRVAVDAQGNGVVLWKGVSHLFAVNILANGGSDPVQTLGEIKAVSEPFDVAMDDQGRGLAVWVRPSGIPGSPETRLAMQEVGPFALALSAQRYTFGGDAIPVTVRLGTPRATVSTVTLTRILPNGATPAGTALFYPGQTELVVNVASEAVTDFVDGRVEATLGDVRNSVPVTLMPEPTDLVLESTPPEVLGGEVSNLRVRIAPIYPAALKVQMASNNAVAPVPAEVTTGATNSAASVPITTTTTTTAQTATFTAQFRGRTATASLLVNPTALGQSMLTVTVPLGHGIVSSTPSGIAACTAECTGSFPIGATVTLTPTPAAGYRFMAWEGDPDCSDGIVRLTSARSCSAIFTPLQTLFVGGSGWTSIALGDRNYRNPTPAMALDLNNPVVAFVLKQTSGSISQLVVRRADGSGFPILGVNGFNLNVSAQAAEPLDASEPAIVTTTTGLPYVTWIEGAGSQQNVYVARLMFSGGAPTWTLVGGNAPLNYVAGSRASSPAISLDGELRPMVAWIENGAVKFKRFDGTAWVMAVGGEGPASASADQVRISSFAGNVPSIAWSQGAGIGRALKVVRDFNFTPLGTQVNPASANTLVEFAVLGDAGAVVVWGDTGISQGLPATTVRTQRWDVTSQAWLNVTSPVVNLNPDTLIGLAIPRNSISVAYAFARQAVDESYLHVSNYVSGAGYVFVAPDLITLRGRRPISFEAANGASPIVVAVDFSGGALYGFTVWQYF